MDCRNLKIKVLDREAMKTNAMRILDTLGIHYDIREYEVDPDDLSAEHVAGDIGLPPEQVFKTLVAEATAMGAAGRRSRQRRSGFEGIGPAIQQPHGGTGRAEGSAAAHGLHPRGRNGFGRQARLSRVRQRRDSVVQRGGGVGGSAGKQMLLAPDDYLRATGASVGPISRAGGGRSAKEHRPPVRPSRRTCLRGRPGFSRLCQVFTAA